MKSPQNPISSLTIVENRTGTLTSNGFLRGICMKSEQNPISSLTIVENRTGTLTSKGLSKGNLDEKVHKIRFRH